MTYHALKDRLVMRFLNTGNFVGELRKDIYGNLIRPLHPVHRKPIRAFLSPRSGEGFSTRDLY